MIKPIKTQQNDNITQIVLKKNMCFNFFNFLKSMLKKESYQASRFYDLEIQNFIQELINKKNYEIILFESIFTTIYLNKLKTLIQMNITTL